MHIEVYSDGSATTADKPGGYGWVMCVDGKKYLEGNGHMTLASNNDAELEAAIQGLLAAKLLVPTLEEMALHNVRVTLVSDSQLVLGWASGRYTFRQANKMDKYKHLQFLVHAMNVDTRWVAGHTGDEHNERCDTLANEARLGVQKKVEKVEAIMEGASVIGRKKTGIVCLWYKNKLKIIDLDNNFIEDYDRKVHGSRGSMLEIKEEKAR